MPIVVTCGACQRSYSVSDGHAGGSVTCPGCKASIVVPHPANAVAQPPDISSSVASLIRRPAGAGSIERAGRAFAIVDRAFTTPFKLRFREYVTGQIAVILWWLGVVGFFVYVASVVRSASEQPEAAIMRFFLGVFALLGLRVVLETVSVLFDIAGSLHDLKEAEKNKT